MEDAMGTKSGSNAVAKVDANTCVVRIGARTFVLPPANLHEALEILSQLEPFGDVARVSTEGTASAGGFLFEYEGVVAERRFDGPNLATILRLLFEFYAAIPQSFDQPYGGSFVHTRPVDSGGGATDHRFFLRVEIRAECRPTLVEWLRLRADSIGKEEWTTFFCD